MWAGSELHTGVGFWKKDSAVWNKWGKEMDDYASPFLYLEADPGPRTCSDWATPDFGMYLNSSYMFGNEEGEREIQKAIARMKENDPPSVQEELEFSECSINLSDTVSHSENKESTSEKPKKKSKKQKDLIF